MPSVDRSTGHALGGLAFSLVILVTGAAVAPETAAAGCLSRSSAANTDPDKVGCGEGIPPALCPPELPADGPDYVDPSRLRYAGQLGGAIVTDAQHGGGGLLEGHLGWQPCSAWGVLASGSVGLGGGTRDPSPYVLISVGVLADLTLQNRFQLGLGPLLAWSVRRRNGVLPFVGGRFRLAWLFDGIGTEPNRRIPGPRLGFGLFADYAPTWATDGTGEVLHVVRAGLVLQSY